VARHRLLRLVGDVVLDEDLILQHRDLHPTVLLAHDHVALDGLPACKELGLRDRGATSLAVTVVTATLALGLQARGSLELVVRSRLVAGAGARPRSRARAARTRAAATSAAARRTLAVVAVLI